MREAFAMARADRTLLKPSVYSVLVGIVYWVAWLAVFLGLEVDFESGGGQALGAIATFGSFLVFYFFMGMTVHLVDVHLAGGTPSLRAAYDDARQNFVAIVFLALISTLVELVAKAVRRQGRESGGIAGVVISLVGGIIESLWTMLSFLLLPAIIIEDASLGDSLRRVRSISKGQYLQIGIGEVGIRVVTNLLGLIVVFALAGVLYVSFGVLGGTTGTVLGIGLGGPLLCLWIAFASYLRMAYYTCLYVWAAKVADEGPQAPAPLPLARAMR